MSKRYKYGGTEKTQKRSVLKSEIVIWCVAAELSNENEKKTKQTNNRNEDERVL